MWSWIIDILVDVVAEPLILSVGHYLLALVGVKPLRSKRWDGYLAAAVGVAAWVVVFVVIGLLVG